MSVTSVVTIMPVPIARKPDDKGNNYYTHRWVVSDQITGDATGGYYQLQANFGTNPQQSYGQHAMFTIEFANIYALGVIATPYSLITIASMERTSGVPLATQFHLGMSDASDTIYDTLTSTLMKFPFRFSASPTGTSYIYLTCSPNTNLVIVQMTVGGFIVDERFLGKATVID